MKTISEYLLELKTQLQMLHGDLDYLEVYTSHLAESFITFKHTKESENFNDRQLEEIFVQQLESPKLIAKSLLGMDDADVDGEKTKIVNKPS